MINELPTAKKKKNNSDYEMTLQSRWQGPYGAPKAFVDQKGQPHLAIPILHWVGPLFAVLIFYWLLDSFPQILLEWNNNLFEYTLFKVVL